MAEETDGKQKASAPPFKVERSLMGVAYGYMDIAERVVSGTLGTSEAREATRALSGVPALVKTQLEAIRVFEKGSEKARAEAAKILDLGVGAREQAAVESNAPKAA
jgi:hypothetical protein